VKFVLETGQNILIHGYEVGLVSITGITADHPEIKTGVIDEWDSDDHLGILRKSTLIRTDGGIETWPPQNTADLSPEHFLPFAELAPEIILFGTGKYLRFPNQDCLTVLQQQNIGYEIMDTAAACRTFNVLAAEGRDVLLAMLMIEEG